MPLRTVQYDLEEEYERIDGEIDECVERAVDAPEGSYPRKQAIQRGNQLEKHLVGVAWALGRDGSDDDEWDVDRPIEWVEIADLTAGEYGKVQDILDSDDSDKGSRGAAENALAGEALVDAPFLDDSWNDDQKFAAVMNLLKPQFRVYLAERADKLSEPEVEGNGFARRVAEKLSDQESE